MTTFLQISVADTLVEATQELSGEATHPGFIAMIFLGLAGLTASLSYPENPTYENSGI